MIDPSVGETRPPLAGLPDLPEPTSPRGLAGFAGGLPRRPLLPLSEAQRTELRTTLEREGLL